MAMSRVCLLPAMKSTMTCLRLSPAPSSTGPIYADFAVGEARHARSLGRRRDSLIWRLRQPLPFVASAHRVMTIGQGRGSAADFATRICLDEEGVGSVRRGNVPSPRANPGGSESTDPRFRSQRQGGLAERASTSRE